MNWHRLVLGKGLRTAHLQLNAVCSLALALSAASFGLHNDAEAQPVVQPLPGPAAGQLSEALRTLDRNPGSLSALVAAGEAALALDDIEASEGFFRRAETIDPANGATKAGLAAIMVHRVQPVEALALFAEAERLGAPLARYGAERGLAYDLVGDNARAQAAYRQALSQNEDTPVVNRLVINRLALSQAIAGDRTASEATLLPLLQQQDLGAYRTRAFALAILGDTDEAVSIAEIILPPEASDRIEPYLRYMPQLTAAQQAAAANLGRFPHTSEIGKDDPALAAVAPDQNPPAATATSPAPSATEPAGEQLIPDAPAPGAGTSNAEAQAPEHQEPAAPESAAPPQSSVAPPTPPPLPVPQSSVGLVEVFSDLIENTGASRVGLSGNIPAAAGAVDITKIDPPREAPKKKEAPKPPPPPPEPSRHWVQLGIGQNTSALAFDWRRIKRQADGLLDEHKPHVARWGRTNRLLIGPFPDTRTAQKLVTTLKAGKIDSLRFTSAEGEAVRLLD